ncbi:hypothetical protein L5515_001021 [Caenorhabditis briggsae]|nr:hypothetical protein L3Y34_014941 [Caenorhabditis briggsae]UMM12045.1 hypothetical protein L5515_001021 [Caenorhabditis briggsae]
MVKATTASNEAVTRILHIGPDVEINLLRFYYYPMWFWVVIAVGFSFCTISCAVWFFCAMYRLRKEKPCNHPVYEIGTVVTKDGEEKPDKMTAQKSEKHCKKVGALSEAESLAKSFKSVRSKKSTKSSRKSSRKSTKSTKKSSKERVDDHEEKPKTEENHDDNGGDQGHKDENGGKSGKSKTSRKSSRKDGGRDDSFIVEMMDQNVGNHGENENIIKKLAGSFVFWK